MRLLTIPDLHGKTVWRQLDPAAYDRLAFLDDAVGHTPQPRIRTFGDATQGITYTDVLRTETTFWEKDFNEP